MKNTFKIYWSDEALKNLKEIIEYLENRWTIKEINKFSKLLNKQLSIIRENPYLFPKSNHHNSTRKSVLSKQTTIYYSIVDSEIRIISLFDNRQNPKKLISKKSK